MFFLNDGKIYVRCGVRTFIQIIARKITFRCINYTKHVQLPYLDKTHSAASPKQNLFGSLI